MSVFQVFCCNTNLSKKVAISVLLWCLVDPLGSEIGGKIGKAQSNLLEADVCSGDSWRIVTLYINEWAQTSIRLTIWWNFD